MTTWLTVRCPDGRDLEVLLAGPVDGFPLLYHSGTPTAAAPMPELSDAAAERGLRTVCWSRPGYATSTPRHGRSVADVVDDVRAVLAELGAERFVTLGWSGGGPHALACAALLPEQCAAAATLAGVAPRDAAGLDWLAGMGQDNVAEFAAARAGDPALTSFLDRHAHDLVAVTGDQVAAALGDLVSEVDLAALTGAYAEELAEAFRRSVSTGIAGWHDDDLAFVRPWGFELADISVPVSVWQGMQDRMVPFDHGRWLAAHVPGARAHLYDDEGHLSLVAQLPRILDDLLDLAGDDLTAR